MLKTAKQLTTITNLKNNGSRKQMSDITLLVLSSVGLGVVSTLLWQEIKPGAVIFWFLWERWFFKKYAGKDISLLACHNNNLYGCRKHPVIYNDMCRIVRGVK